MWGGGCLGTHGQVRTVRKYVGRATTRVVCPPPPRLLSEHHTFYAGACVTGVFRWQSQPGGRGLMVCSPLPLVGSLIGCPKLRATTMTGSTRTPTSPRASMPPLHSAQYISNKKPEFGRLNGRTSRIFFLHTRATLTHPLVKIGIYNYESE